MSMIDLASWLGSLGRLGVICPQYLFNPLDALNQSVTIMRRQRPNANAVRYQTFCRLGLLVL
jgi:hypothetical protein